MPGVITGIVGAKSKDKAPANEIENPRPEQTTKDRERKEAHRVARAHPHRQSNANIPLLVLCGGCCCCCCWGLYPGWAEACTLLTPGVATMGLCRPYTAVGVLAPVFAQLPSVIVRPA